MTRTDKHLERRILILAPTRKDAALTQEFFERAQIGSDVCYSFDDLMRELENGASAVLIPEEAILEDQCTALAAYVAKQPAWSDLPVLVLTRQGADSPTVRQALDTLGNVTLLERPTRITSLISAARTAVRARERQYQARELLVEQQRNAQALQAADRRKDQFLATLAHELRNPLAPIRNTIGALRMSASADPQTRAHYDMMDRQVNHLVRLVDDLLELSRVTRGQFELRRELVSVADVIKNAEEISRPFIDFNRHMLAVSLPVESMYVHGDPVRLAQIVSNLLNNSAKYTDPGGHIQLNVSRDADEVVITVRDNGIGIRPEMQPYVFEMFAQIDRRADRSQSGLGIGLTLVRTLVERHGGTISVYSEGENCGSEFTVRLPLARRPEPAATAAPQASGSPTNGKARRVLVVDDNVDAAKSLGLLLKHYGAAVEIANDGPTALDIIREQRPEIVLLDLGMPGMDGFAVAERVRAEHDFDNVILVALTGWGQDDDRRRTEDAGFNHHLVKPADLAALQRLLSATATSGV